MYESRTPQKDLKNCGAELASFINSLPMKNRICPLCGNSTAGQIIYANEREYHSCQNCGLIYLGRQFLLPPDEEKARYGEHNNDPGDEKYIEHLSALTDELLPFLSYLPHGASGLDFGSGPGPAIDGMMKGHGFSVENYDPFFNNDRSLLQKRYGFITCTETAEHFHDPSLEFDLLHSLLNKGGLLGIMTNFLYDDIDFAQWWYPRDPTHVSFYTPQTMDYISKRFNWEIKFFRGNVIIYSKK